MRVYHDDAGRLIIGRDGLSVACGMIFTLIVCAMGSLLDAEGRGGVLVGAVVVVPFMMLGLAHAMRRTILDPAAGTIEVESMYLPALGRSFTTYRLREVTRCGTRSRIERGEDGDSLVHDAYLEFRSGVGEARIATCGDAAVIAEVERAVQQYLAPPAPVAPVMVHPMRLITATGDCGVCGAAMRESCVTCPRCETPHHADCWVYNTGCAVYGCGTH